MCKGRLRFFISLRNLNPVLSCLDTLPSLDVIFLHIRLQDLKTKLHRATISRVIMTGTLRIRYSAVELMHEVSHVTPTFELSNLRLIWSHPDQVEPKCVSLQYYHMHYEHVYCSRNKKKKGTERLTQVN